MAQIPTPQPGKSPRSDPDVPAKRQSVRPAARSDGRQPARTPARPAGQPAEELPGIMGFMARNTRLLAWLELVAAILLLYFSAQGFLNGEVFFPFGFGLMGLYFFYAYVRNGLKANFGSLTVPLNLVLLLGALVCLVLGIQNEGK